MGYLIDMQVNDSNGLIQRFKFEAEGLEGKVYLKSILGNSSTVAIEEVHERRDVHSSRCCHVDFVGMLFGHSRLSSFHLHTVEAILILHCIA